MNQMTQAQLLKLSEKHAGNAAVAALRTSLLESANIAVEAQSRVEAHLAVQRSALSSVPGFSVSLDNSDFVAAAAKAAAALSRMAGDYFTLACALQGLGEDVCY